ncbi:PREDICTED: uncharacterized protein LOC104598045 [Nelumbo nucifera]|uniref:Uncharacterized protein LOC104598045 n=1 Tax=Nelumbo nucifera TaxID=4432 RepID=A0A1U8A8E8_NELNU|nr:PREDICTED: uncharacterized protein LOC104598045 [Nelumbo nucifera]
MATLMVDFCGVLSESNKIVNAHSRHFLALSVLFLLPLSFSLIFYPTFQQTVTAPDTSPTETLLRYTPEQRFLIKTVVLCLLFTFGTFILSLCATGTVTYSVFHGFFGRPVKLISAIKSLSNSFIRLFVTILFAQVIVLSIAVVLGLVMFFLIKGIGFLGFDVSQSSTCVTVVYTIGLVVLVLVAVYLQVNWALACVVVVVESSWGVEPLRRSSYLIKGMRGVAAYLLLFFGLISGLMLWGNWEPMNVGDLKDWMSVVGTVVGSAFIMLILLHSISASTVLYMHCKALHGELAGEIAEEFAQEYVSLPFDDKKVPHVVFVIQP